LLKTLTRERALIRRHCNPTLTATRERRLPLRRETLPLRGVRPQQLLLLGRQI
jgi:hypothetical protein